MLHKLLSSTTVKQQADPKRLPNNQKKIAEKVEAKNIAKN